MFAFRHHMNGITNDISGIDKQSSKILY